MKAVLGAKKQIFRGATRIYGKMPSLAYFIRLQYNGCTRRSLRNKSLQSALESPFANPPDTALPPSAALYCGKEVLLLFLKGYM